MLNTVTITKEPDPRAWQHNGWGLLILAQATTKFTGRHVTLSANATVNRKLLGI